MDQASPQPARPISPRAIVWPILLAATIVAESSRVMPEVPGEFPGFDKVAHFGVYGLLGTALLRAPIVWRRRGRILLTVCLASFFGATDEWHQYFVPGRSCEFLDWVADTLGPALAVTLYLCWPLYRRVLEMPVRWRRRRASAPALVPASAPAPATTPTPDAVSALPDSNVPPVDSPPSESPKQF